MARARSFVDRLRAAALVVVVALAAALAAPSDAGAQTAPAGGWRICNQTSFVVELAHARPDGRATLVQGWLRLRPGECRVAVSAPLARGTHHLFARSSRAHRGGRRQWGGSVNLCVDPTATFTIENPPRCAAMGLEERGFREVRITRREGWLTNLSETEPYSLARARAAGLQRLLADAGVDARGVRGGGARGISEAISGFRTQARLPADATEEQLIDALEAAARRRADSIGLTLCNRAAETIWTAIASRRDEAWESRGWWPLAPGGCARAIDDALSQRMYFVHAVMPTREGDRFLSLGGETFCTSATRFTILGREECAPRFHDEAVFGAITPKDKEGLVVEFAEKDFLPVGVKPRRVSLPEMAADERAARAAASAANPTPRPPARPSQGAASPGRSGGTLPGATRPAGETATGDGPAAGG